MDAKLMKDDENVQTINCLAFTEYEGNIKERIDGIINYSNESLGNNFRKTFSFCSLFMGSMLPQNSILIPIPTKKNNIQSNFILASMLSSNNKGNMLDILEYDNNENDEVRFRFKYPIPRSIRNKPIFFIDTLLSDGKTAKAALQLIPKANMLVMGIDLNAAKQSNVRINWLNHITDVAVEKTNKSIYKGGNIRCKINGEQQMWKRVAPDGWKEIVNNQNSDIKNQVLLYYANHTFLNTILNNRQNETKGLKR